MNRNNRLYTVDANGKKNFTATGLLLHFFAMAEGLAGDPTNEERDLSRAIVDEVMESANLESPLLCMVKGAAEERLIQIVERLEAACAAIGEDGALQIIHRPYAQTIH